ncbi:DUF559 domain-containing protein [Achromobacter sp. Marseille-Q0513]|uniref:DUF559 domain-containing protein n=1 Tax=Achromobacter sp. Marseille-Q0513 TaxID=2829161 RepID=UPI001B8F01E1|nr:DUF559 domain-containing protein [Achromobacter sp. Marseille-Q0513]MBR8653158.1 DUF559 domain-containing protein [Achromobacter sp. Marseille-Q0513]
MAKIRGTGNRSTELAVAQGFRSAHITGWRRHVTFTFRIQVPPGSTAAGNTQIVRVRPDFIFRKTRLAIFVDGCFWHCCPIHSKIPESNRSFWEPKLQANVARDRRATHLMHGAGWGVLRFWEHELRDMEHFLENIKRHLKATQLPL